MEYEDIYNLSNVFAPPKVNLRQGRILDDYGDETYAKLLVNHSKPDDVTLDEINYYGWVYPFLEAEDLIFYLYSLAIEYKKDKLLDCFDSFMYSMDKNVIALQGKLTKTQNETLKKAFELIWEIGGDEWADWRQCPNLQKLIGITVE